MRICDYCGRAFSDDAKYNVHIRDYHVCQKCGKEFRSKEGKDAHEFECKGPNSCPDCRGMVLFDCEENLKQHLREIHGRVYECDCGEYMGTSQKNLSRHILNMHKDYVPLSQPCAAASSQESSSFGLNGGYVGELGSRFSEGVHLSPSAFHDGATHNFTPYEPYTVAAGGLRNPQYPLPIMPPVPEQYDPYRGPQAVSVSNGSSSQTTCRVCGHDFKRKSKLRAHIAAADKEKEHERPIACKHCPQLFCTKCTYNKHCVKNHPDATPCTCEICGHKFRDDCNLRKHTNSATGLYTCSRCNRKFCHLCKLQEHVKRCGSSSRPDLPQPVSQAFVPPHDSFSGYPSALSQGLQHEYDPFRKHFAEPLPLCAVAAAGGGLQHTQPPLPLQATVVQLPEYNEEEECRLPSSFFGDYNPDEWN